MPMEEKRKQKFEEEEEEKAVIKLSSGDEDDDEANEDLSLKIVEKSLLMRAAKLAQNDNGIVVLDDDDSNNDNPNVFKNDSGVVGVSSRNEAEVVVVKEGKKRKKKKKVQKREIENQSEAEQLEDKAEPKEKAADETEIDAMELDRNVDRNAIEVDQNMVLRKLLRGPRYFDPPDSGWSTTCFNCGNEGHMAANCPSFQKKRRPCFLCGSLEHGVKQCSKERVCIICKSVGHRPNKCPEKHKGGPQSSKVCLKCGDSGHDMFSCKNSYTYDDLKEIQCYICKNVGHLCCVSYIDNSPSEVSCYKCGEIGHTGLECSSLHEEAATTASSNSCFKCGEEGHFARECTSSAKAGKRNLELSTPTFRSHKENKEALGFKSDPQDLGKSRKKSKSKLEDRSNTTPKKSKQRGGWLTEDPGDYSQSKSKKNRWMSPSTPFYNQGLRISNGTIGAQMMSSSQYSKRMHKSYSGMSSSPSYKGTQNNHWGTSAFQGSVSPYDHRYSASRFSNSGNAGFRGNYNWW